MPARSILQLIDRSVAVVTLQTRFWERSWKHRAGRLGVHGLYGYLGILLLLLSLEDWLLYHPGTAEDWAPPPRGVPVEDVKLTSCDGCRVHAWWAAPPGWGPGQGAVLLCHGNAGNLSYRGCYLCDWLEEMKVGVLLFDYPGFGRSTGRPSEASCYAAGDAAYDYLTGVRQVPGERVVLYGGSLGGGIATDLAGRRPHRALVLVSTFTSFPDMAQKQYPWLPGRWLVHNRFENLRKISGCRGPVFIAHGTRDGLIPISQAERLFAAAPEPKRFFPMLDHGHNDALTPPGFRALRQFLEEVERGGRQTASAER